MVMFSKRFEKEYEVEAIEQNGLKVARFSSLKALLDELGSAVKVAVTPLLQNPVYGFECVIRDDAGAEARAYGSVNINVEKGIPKQFVLETAYSRALSAAVIEYFGFEDRVYSDVAIVPETPSDATAETVDAEVVVTEEPAAKPVPARKPAPAPQAAKPKTPAPKAEAKNDPGEFIIPFGSALKGKKVKELTKSQLDWIAGDSFEARGKAATDAKKAVKEFLAAKKGG